MPSRSPSAPKGCSSLKLRQVSRRVSQMFDEYVAQAGLKTTQYSLLSHIVRLGPVQPGKLAAAMEMEASTLTRNLQVLVAQGWAEIMEGTDGRSRLVQATSEGVKMQAAAKKQWARAQQAFNEQLGEPLVSRLHAVLDECLQALRAEVPPSESP